MAINTRMFINLYDYVEVCCSSHPVTFTTVPWIIESDFEMPVLRGDFWEWRDGPGRYDARRSRDARSVYVSEAEAQAAGEAACFDGRQLVRRAVQQAINQYAEKTGKAMVIQHADYFRSVTDRFRCAGIPETDPSVMDGYDPEEELARHLREGRPDPRVKY